MDIISNLDLFSVGLTVAGTFILGYTVFFNNRKSITNRSFLFFSTVTGVWGLVNYLQYQFPSPTLTLWLIRLVMFLAVWQAFFIFQLFYVYPKEQFKFSNIYRFILLPITLFTSIIALSPLLFPRLIGEVIAGKVAEVEKGPGILLFAVVAVGLVISGLTVFIRKILNHEKYGVEKKATSIILVGTFLAFLLIIFFNFVMPNVFQNLNYLPLGALFAFPFVLFTSYALFQSGTLTFEIFSTGALTFTLTVATFFEVVLSNNTALVLFRSAIFLLVLFASIMLVQTMLREIKQREYIQKLAADLADANEKLKELDKKKTEFVSLASHQLRSPLTAIKGYSSMIIEGDFGPIGEKAKEAVGRVFESSQKLVLVIEDFLNITRIELGRMKYAVTEVDIGQLVQNVIAEIKPNVEKRGLALTYEADQADYKIWADMGKISEVYSNLLDNAIKYTEKGFVKVHLSRIKNEKEGRDYVRFQISDSGVGIGPETLPHLFEKFTRAEDASKTNIIGTGLGLYVARQIVEAHGGKIWAESPGKGQGSTFYVDLTIEGGKNLMAIMQNEQLAAAANPPQQPSQQSNTQASPTLVSPQTEVGMKAEA